MVTIAIMVTVAITVVVSVAITVVEVVEVEGGGASVVRLRTVGEAIMRGRGWG